MMKEHIRELGKLKPDTVIFFIGSYTQLITDDFGGSGQGIYTVSLNTEMGKVTLLHAKSSTNPSYVVISDNHNFLYCVTEVRIDENPKVQAYKIRNDFSLEFLNEQPIKGAYPCHIEFLNNSVLIPCYGSGGVLQFFIGTDGKVLDEDANFQHAGKSINADRQEGPHPHQIVVLPNKEDVFVADLGIDTLKAYKLVEDKLASNKFGDVSIEKGGGPRHIVFNKDGDIGYAISELTGNVSVLKFKNKKFEVIQLYKSLPSSYKDIPSASAIRIHPNGEFLYVGNRIFDAVTIFKINDDKLELVDYHSTGGITLRDFNLSPDGKWLVACHQDSNDTVVYKITSKGKLIEKHRTTAMVSPVCVVFMRI